MVTDGKNIEEMLLSGRGNPAFFGVVQTLAIREYESMKIGARLGTETEIAVNSPLLIALACVAVSAVMIPIQLLELGEEAGWRGYLLGFQVEKYGERKAVLINGIEWGIAHLPLIYYGFNYSLDNPGAPWSNMGMMIVTCVVLGILLSYVTIKTGNCMYAAVIHGVVNVIGELPVYLSVDVASGLLGPNPTGIITMLPLIITAIICFRKLGKKANSDMLGGLLAIMRRIGK